MVAADHFRRCFCCILPVDTGAGAELPFRILVQSRPASAYCPGFPDGFAPGILWQLSMAEILFVPDRAHSAGPFSQPGSVLERKGPAAVPFINSLHAG